MTDRQRESQRPIHRQMLYFIYVCLEVKKISLIIVSILDLLEIENFLYG